MELEHCLLFQIGDRYVNTFSKKRRCFLHGIIYGPANTIWGLAFPNS